MSIMMVFTTVNNNMSTRRCYWMFS